MSEWKKDWLLSEARMAQMLVAVGEERENERIIALLEERRKDLAAQGGYTESFTIGYAIALIKGENE